MSGFKLKGREFWFGPRQCISGLLETWRNSCVNLIPKNLGFFDDAQMHSTDQSIIAPAPKFEKPTL